MGWRLVHRGALDVAGKAPSIRGVCKALEALASTALAQSWDNVGLLAGDPAGPCRRVMVCGDLTPSVADEAIGAAIDLLVCYHPPIFKPISRLAADGRGPEADVARCLMAGISLYCIHTALDAAPGGTNHVLAEMIGLTIEGPLEFVDRPSGRHGAPVKLVVFVPHASVERVADALSAAGAGVIGNYARCSFRIPGTGAFFGGEGANPVIGEKGRLENVEEIRLEMVCPAVRLPEAVAALRAVHPYEEPAFDLYPLRAEPTAGIGVRGRLPKPTPLSDLAGRLKTAIPAPLTAVVGDPALVVERAAILVGSAGLLPLAAGIEPPFVVITGEIRHHDALAIERQGACAIALGHWTSERPGVVRFAENLRERLKAMTLGPIEVSLSQTDRDVFGSP